MELWYDLIW